MLEDIKNIMNSKRLNSDSKVSRAFIQDTKTGELYDVKTDSDFLFGRFLKSSIVIEALYISRSHCSIMYENDQFVLRDNKSCTGTYLNYNKINTSVVLQNGDLIAFTDKSKTWDFVYKFCLSSSPRKKPRLEEESSIAEDKDKIKSSMEKLKNHVKELKVDRTNILNNVQAQKDELKKLIDNATKLNAKMNKEMLKLQDKNQKLNNEISAYRKRCETQKELLDTKSAKEESVELFKVRITKLLESDFQCAICNEVMFRATTTDCNHTFCESCLKTWLARSSICPACRSTVHSMTHCLALDNYITNLCDILGGTVKEQRLTMQSERHPPQVAKRGRKRGNVSTNRRIPVYDASDLTLSTPNRFINLTANSTFPNERQRYIEIVDLTNNTSR